MSLKRDKIFSRLRAIAAEYNELLHSSFATEAYLEKYSSKNRVELLKDIALEKAKMIKLDRERQEIYELLY